MENATDDYRYFQALVYDSMLECRYDSNEDSYSLESTDFRAYQSKLWLIRTLPDFPRQLQTEYPPSISLLHHGYSSFRDDMSEYFNTEFPRFVRKFHADNKFWKRYGMAHSCPDVYTPSGTINVRMRNESERPRHPIVYKGKLYTSGLDHFLLMWGHPWERYFTEKDMTPEALEMLIAVQSINKKVDINADEVPVQLIPFEISPDGKLFLGGLQTDAFLPWDGNCLWLQSFVGSPDDYRIV